MPLDPFIEPLLGALPPMTDPDGDFDAWRAQGAAGAELMVSQVAEPGPEVGSIDEITLPVDGGTIALRVYRPSAPGPHPAHVFLHGGGWVAGSVRDSFVDIVCRERCAGTGSVVVAVDYRKAPEHPAPIPLQDCHAALTWLVENASEHDVRPDVITIGGQSAGANLAAALAITVRDGGGPRIALQLLEVPALDLTLSQPSYTTLATGYGLETTDIAKTVGWYVGADADADAVRDQLVSPLLADDLSGLPRAHVMSSEYDPTRDDGEAYVMRLQDAGVPASFSLQQGHIHFSSSFTKVMPSARQWHDECLAVLREVNDAETGREAGSL